MIAKLAEGRKAQKSIYAFGPVASISVPVRATVPKVTPQSGNPDLLSSILASQTQLTTFGKSTEVIRPSRPRNANSNRVLGAILASQATLSRLDETIQLLGQSQERKTTKPEQPKPAESRKPLKSCTTRQSDATDQGSNSSSNHHQTPSEGSTHNDHPATVRSNGQSGGENSGNGISGGSDGNGEDPNRNRKKKSDPEDKKDDIDDEDVDLYSDIESIEEENEPLPELLPKNDVNYQIFYLKFFK